MPAAPVVPAAPAATPKASVEAAPATILVSLPANATLTVDGTATTGNSNSRLLVSPNLNQGVEYTYTLQAQVVRDGQTLQQTQRVAVRAGEQSRVNFEFAGTGVASNR
jgi:uncharacterized protein (TIGR03000 family)